MTRREFLSLSLLIPFAARLYGKGATTIEDARAFIGEDVFERLQARIAAEHWSRLAVGALTGQVGMALQGTPYVGSTLELYDDREVCSVNLAGLDCVTFYEVSLAFARMAKHHGKTPQDLIQEVRFMRYRGGKLNGYLSRLHYTCDWIDDNESKGVVKNLTSTFQGAVRMDKKFDYMSRHPQAYRQLKANPALIPQMAAFEDGCSARRPWYVPNDHVASIEPLLQTGDIVGIATSADGLDCSHTGLIYVDDAKVCRFLNASSVKKQVVLGERLSDYANKYKKNIGVMIARPI
jgi:hypothetical protein